MRVVAVDATDDDHDIASSRQIARGVLPLLGGLADCVLKTHLGRWKSTTDQRHELMDPFDRLSGLRNHAESGARLQSFHILLRQNDVELIEIKEKAPAALPPGHP